MNPDVGGFGKNAINLSRNPLGIIALFIVLVYGMATLVIIFADTLTEIERTLLIIFLIGFPLIVFIVFVWLVVKHGPKLYSPGDYRKDENYLKAVRTATLLSAASYKQGIEDKPLEIDTILQSFERRDLITHNNTFDWTNEILWVDDRPENNIYERKAFESIGLQITLALNTEQALQFLSRNKYAVVISDMGRKEGPREGYVLLDTMRQKSDNTPLVFYAASNLPEHKQETMEHGGQGCTNNPTELFNIVTDLVRKRKQEL